MRLLSAGDVVQRLSILVVLLCCGALSAAESPRLNVLLVFADDWGRYASAYRGLDGRPTLNDVVRTPHVDRLAKEGVLFRNAFVNAPSCTPCRSSLLTGRYFFNCGRGAILQGAVWNDELPTFPLGVRDAGYHIGKSYKVWSPGTPADAPFGGQKYGYEKAGRLPNNFSEEVAKQMAEGQSPAEARAKILSQLGRNFANFLADRKPDQPWLYFCGITTTHRTWVKGSGKSQWGIEPDDLRGKLPKFLPDVSEIREDVADYLGECQAVDACIGELLKSLEDQRQVENTLVIVSGDHGMPGVPHGKCDLYDHGTAVPLVIRKPGAKGGRVVDDLVMLPDLAPTIWETAGVKPPEGIAGRSLLPLLAAEKSGRIDPERDAVLFGRERHVAEARTGKLPYPMRGLRTHDYLYIRNFAPDRYPLGDPGEVTAHAAPSQEKLEQNTRSCFADMDASPTKAWLVLHRDGAEVKPFFDRAFGKRPAEELYDLKSDPDQMHNLADDPSRAKVKADLSERLQSMLRAAGDPRVGPEPIPFERSPFID